MTYQLPILLVHGIGSYDRSLESSEEWGRTPERLRERGASVWFANQDAFGGIESNAHQIAEAIKQVLQRTGARRVQIVAHSKGGLDARAAMYLPGVVENVSSLITLATPHKGLRFCNLLAKAWPGVPYVVVPYANRLGHSFGDVYPDSRQALHDMTTKGIRQLFAEPCPLPHVRSFGFSLYRKGKANKFNPVSAVVSLTDGENDGLVALRSTAYAEWTIVNVISDGPFDHTDITDKHRRDTSLLMPDGTKFSSAADFIVGVVEKMERHIENGVGTK